MSDDLTARVVVLGALVHRGDCQRWIRDLDAATPERRAAIRASLSDPGRSADGRRRCEPLTELIDIVGEYGGARVLEAVSEEAQRQRREWLRR
jgi:hypothetical protein